MTSFNFNISSKQYLRCPFLFNTIWQNRSLVYELIKRDFSSRYLGSFGGVAWSFMQPLFMLSVYTIAFGVILKARWGFAGSTKDYALMLFAGLIIFNTFSEVLIKSTTLITSNPNFVKKIVFPLELMPIICVCTALIHTLIGVAVWTLGYVVIYGSLQSTVILFPLVLICFFPFLLGVSWLLSAFGVMVRDISHIAGMLNHALLFLTPIFYSIEAAPPLLQNLLMLNPLTFVVEQFRLVLFIGVIPAMKSLALYFAFASSFAFGALIIFRRLRPSFADVL